MKRKLFRVGSLMLATIMCLSMTAFAAGSTSFKDVSESDYFYPAVEWGVEDGITNGMGNGNYEPQGKVTRAQAVTFLWRMAGEPVPTNTTTFSDVKSGSWYDTAVRWAVGEGITQGTGDGKFSPDETLDRAMCVTLLYRMEGSPYDEVDAAPRIEITDDSSWDDFGIYMIQMLIDSFRETDELFPDVEEGTYYELAVIWGALNGILTENNTGEMVEGVKFRPTDPCVRAEMISFLYQTKLMKDALKAPELLELDGSVTVAIPLDYTDLVFRSYNALADDEEGILITISEIASRDASEALGEDPDETGAGELFAIGRVREAEAKQIAEEDIGFGEVFAKDDNGWYYVFYHPTDVRYVRETNEQMTADQDQWTTLVEWASETVVSDILEYSEGLTPVTMESLRQG